jgi:hypothetical protein
VHCSFQLGCHLPPETDNTAAQQLGLFALEEDAFFPMGPYYCAVGTLVNHGEFPPVILNAGVGPGYTAVLKAQTFYIERLLSVA